MAESGTPIVHVTDLHHPPHDVDDLFDLLTIYGLPGANVAAVLLDVLGDVGDDPGMYEPGFVPVTQLNWLTARAVPVAAGPRTRLATPDDAGYGYPPQEQTAIELFLSTLRASEVPVAVTSVGSCRIIACAFNRDPELCRSRIAAVHLVAGCAHYFDRTGGTDYNVKIDPHAHDCLFRSGLPIRWYPCSAASPYRSGESAQYRRHSSRWEYPQKALARDLDPRLHAWMVLNLSGNLRGDLIRALNERWYGGTWWAAIKQGIRWFWSTAALVHAAGCVLAKTDDGWRFVPQAAAKELELEKLDLIPVSVTLTGDGFTEWEPARENHIQLYEREPGQAHNDRMGEALNALMRGLVPGAEDYGDKSPTIA